MDDSINSNDLTDLVAKAVNAAPDLPKTTIVVVCFNVLVQTMEGEYIPIEVGISKLSVAEGVHHESYHKMIHFVIPEGYYANARAFSDNFHNIPIIADHEMFERDSMLIFDEVYHHLSASGLKDDQNRSIVFCKAEDATNGLSDRPQVVGCLVALEEAFLKKCRDVGRQTNKSLVDDFVVAELQDMLFLTAKRLCVGVMPRVLAGDSLRQSIFDYYPDMRCDFHAENDNNYCALAVVKRSAFLFLDFVFKTGLKAELNIKPKASHRPKEPEDNSVSLKLKTFTAIQPPVNHYSRGYRAPKRPNNSPPVERPIRRIPEERTPNIGIGRARAFPRRYD